MSGMIDLMPANCREALGRHARVRRWMLCYVVSSGVLLGLWAWAGADLGAMREEKAQLEHEVTLRFEQNEQVQRLLSEREDVEAAITRYNSLAWPIRLTEVIDAVGEAIPEGMTLTSLMATPRHTRFQRQRSRDGEERQSNLVVEIEGVAPMDLAVSTMVHGLESNPLFPLVTLEYSRTVLVDGVSARSFRVTCEIDLDGRYTFVDAEPSRRGVSQ